ncbi:putative Ubiquinone biosynthesis O-methyltransferase, mitochondrial (putative) [Pseudozyma hubeiensis]|nr:putative Ubiquinone biosynthesis O-methyltransferase, mitochondrial (putative) [Pseudozyma hubeiensis]
MTITLGSIVGRIFEALSSIRLAPPVPTPFPDRLAALDPAESTIDNDIYDTQSFDWSRSGLELLNPARVGYFMDKLHRRISSLSPDEKREITIVDLGCGAGLAIEAIHSAILRSSGGGSRVKQTESGLFDGTTTYKLIGIDVSTRSISTARQRALSRSLSISYVVGDIYSLPFPTSSVDAIICSDVLEHLFDLPLAFSSIARILKPNAIFSFDTINRTPTSYYLTIWILQDILRAMQGDAHDHRLYVTPQEVHAVMRSNGLKPGPERDLVGMRPGLNWPPVALYRLMTGVGFINSVLAEFRLTKDMSISYLHWCEKV